MLFNSFHFLLFYAVVLVGYFALPQRFRWVLLLAASYYFYMCWRPVYALLLVALTLVGYLAGIAIENSSGPALRRAWLVIAVAAFAGVLIYFKYLDVLLASLNTAASAFNSSWRSPLLHLLIPVGISFHAFQSIGYVFDVERRAIRAERHLGIYALFIVFFPQLLAGPIERSGHMLPQFRRTHELLHDRISSGLRWAEWGLFKKIVIADRVGIFVNAVYSEPRHYNGSVILLATVLFSVQIYCDFSGYSDIAVGIARIMGYDLMINFRQPYFARSIGEFWTRWHISLSTWFRDYLYIPLGGNRVSKGRWTLNILIVFVISGLWHGSALLFGLWGLVHAGYLLLGRFTAAVRAKFTGLRGLGGVPGMSAVRSAFSMLTVFALVTFAWIFFRARSLGDVQYILGHFWRLERITLDDIYGLGLPRFEFITVLASIAILIAVDLWLCYRPRLAQTLWNLRGVRWGCYAACAYAIVFFGVFGHIEFIYFQF